MGERQNGKKRCWALCPMCKEALVKHARCAGMIDVTNLGYHDKFSSMWLSVPLESNRREYLSVGNHH